MYLYLLVFSIIFKSYSDSLMDLDFQAKDRAEFRFSNQIQIKY